MSFGHHDVKRRVSFEPDVQRFFRGGVRSCQQRLGLGVHHHDVALLLGAVVLKGV